MRGESTLKRIVAAVALLAALALVPAWAAPAEALYRSSVFVEAYCPQSLPATTTTDPAVRPLAERAHFVPSFSQQKALLGHDFAADASPAPSPDEVVAPKSAAELRNGPGIAFGGSELPVSPRSILRGTEGNAGLIPREIADKLAGRQFGSFKEFRQAFWQEVAASPYAAEFQRINIRNLARMRKGYAPLVRSSQMFRGQFKYILHHRMPISQGGAVYDLENLLISSPRCHAELLDAAFHAGR